MLDPQETMQQAQDGDTMRLQKSIMTKVKVTVLTGDKEVDVGIPTDWAVERFIKQFINKLNLFEDDEIFNPIFDGAILKRTGKMLDPQETMQQAEVQDGDIIRLQKSTMTKVKVTVLDEMGSKEAHVDIPTNWTVERFIEVLLNKLNLPIVNSHFATTTYEAVLIRTERILNPQETIQQAKVQDGDIVRLRTRQEGGCLLAGTKVAISLDKTISIEDIKPGHFVLSWSSQKSIIENSKVKQLYKGSCKSYYLINDKLPVTGTHLFYCNGVWKQASELNIGDILKTTDGEQLIEKIKLLHKSAIVYNLEIEENKTFFAEGILVHNLTEKLKYGDLLKESLKSSLSEHKTIPEHLFKRIETLEEREDITDQKKLAIKYLFTIYSVLIFSTLAIIFLEGFHLYGFDIDDGLLKWIGMSILGEVAGLVGLVYGSLFKNNKS